MSLKIKNSFLLLIICFSNLILPKLVFGITDEGEWKPQIVEKMYILPPKQLNRVLDNDFKSSSLATILNNKDQNIKSRHLKRVNLNEAILGFDGEEKIELQHQLIVEKKDYIKDMHQMLKLKKRELNTRKQFFKNIEKKVKIKNSLNLNNSSLIKNRNKILEKSSNLDNKIFDDVFLSSAKKSKYAEAYIKNKTAISRLKEAITKHPMSSFDSKSATSNKINSINNYVENIESEVAIIELKEELLNYMAKLVALDAMQLAENITENINDENHSKNFNDPNDAIEFFIN
jgi:hypothetical protein